MKNYSTPTISQVFSGPVRPGVQFDSRDTSHPRWLALVLATTAILISTLAPLARAGQFLEVTSQVGLVQEAKKSYGNPVFGDFNNDGFPDLLVPCHGLTLSKGPFVYLNGGGHSFIDIRPTCGIQEAPEFDSTDWHGFALGDYDGDGNLDLYITEGSKMGGLAKRDLLFHGNGDGTFTYVSDVAGMVTSVDRGRQGFWLDYNNDGKLDLFVKNSFDINRLYQNNGDGTFALVDHAAGLDQASLGTDTGSTCSFADYDNDGFIDAFFTGDGEMGINNTDALYRNRGDGTYVEVTDAAGIIRYPYGHGIAWGDYNNDGFLDLYVARVGSRTDTPQARLYRNNGDGTFTDVTAQTGLLSSANTYGAVWGDYDNDGYLDLFVTNSGDNDLGPGNNNFLYHNNGDGTFTDRAAAEGVELEDNTSTHKGAAWTDYDNDGFLDLIVKDGVGGESGDSPNVLGLHRLFRNVGNGNHYIKVTLTGVQSNLRGIGARATATYAGGIAFRENNGGGGGENASQGSEPLHFGIGSATTATVEVDWPSGIVDRVNSVHGNSTINVVEGSTGLPWVTTQPRDTSAKVGKSARFRVAASSTTRLQYQWQKNGTNIDGATKSSYSTPPTTQSDDGAKFDVVLTNRSGSVTSRMATLRVK